MTQEATPKPDNILELRREPDPAIVSMLEDLLDSARSGQILGIIALTNEVGTYRRWSAGLWKVEQALFLFEQWKHRLLFGDHD